jgi:hypothetical protein
VLNHVALLQQVHALALAQAQAQQAHVRDVQAQKLERLADKQAAVDGTPQGDKESPLAAYYPDQTAPTSVGGCRTAPLVAGEGAPARVVFGLLGRAAADLVCALMDCSKVSPELLAAMVYEGRVLDYIQAAAFTPAQAETWMTFLAAAMVPALTPDPPEESVQAPPLPPDICNEVMLPVPLLFVSDNLSCANPP